MKALHLVVQQRRRTAAEEHELPLGRRAEIQHPIKAQNKQADCSKVTVAPKKAFRAPVKEINDARAALGEPRGRPYPNPRHATTRGDCGATVCTACINSRCFVSSEKSTYSECSCSRVSSGIATWGYDPETAAAGGHNPPPHAPRLASNAAGAIRPHFYQNTKLRNNALFCTHNK